MPNRRTSDLHLPDLLIRNFRGIENLTIGPLGRVTLLAGRNGVCKTTVLEAVRVYAARGHEDELTRLLTKREEFVASIDEVGATTIAVDFAALFHGRTTTQDQAIKIGPSLDADTLRIQVKTPSQLTEKQQAMFAGVLPEVDAQVVSVTYKKHQSFLPVFPNTQEHYIPGWMRQRFQHKNAINYESLGPGITGNSTLARLWDSVVLTEGELLSLEILGLVGSDIERVAVIGDEEKHYSKRSVGRRVVVKLRGQSRPVPLRSLGDGIVRLFAAGLALTSCRNGFLIIDEVENGIHHSIQPRFWRMILSAAQQHNVQVLASTHSYDCVKGFAQASAETDNAEGVLIRLERKDTGLQAVRYTEDELETAIEVDFEVR